MRLIDADELKKEVLKWMPSDPCGKEEKEYPFETDIVASLMMEIEDAPSIDIVFCGNCRECVEKGTGVDCPSGCGYLYCKRKKAVVDETDFCSWGIER